MIKKIYVILSALLLVSPVNAQRDRLDLGWLLEVDPTTLSGKELFNKAVELESDYQKFHQSHGIIWTASYENVDDKIPTSYSAVADNALFTGFYLAAATYRFMVTNKEQDLDKILQTLRGIHILTHISGIPGVLARNAFPAEMAKNWKYPEGWRARIERGFVYKSASGVPDILNPDAFYPPMIFYARATRDQLSGILFGLAITIANLRKQELQQLSQLRRKIEECQKISAEIGTVVYNRLKSNRYKIRDHLGLTGTTASRVSGLLKLQLLALYKEILKDKGNWYSHEYKEFMIKYRESFHQSILFNGRTNFLQPLFGGYYAWNLRMARAFSIWILEDDPERRQKIVAFTRKRIWKFVRYHENSHFNFLFYAMNPEDQSKLFEGVLSLKRFYFRPMRSWNSPCILSEKDPCHESRKGPSVIRQLLRMDKAYVIPAHLRKFSRFFIWQKDPFKVGDRDEKNLGNQRSPGLSYLLPYWMGRYYGFIAAP